MKKISNLTKEMINGFNYKILIIFVALIIFTLVLTTFVLYFRGRQYNYTTLTQEQNYEDTTSKLGNNQHENNSNDNLRSELEKKFVEKFETYVGLDWQ